METLRHLFLHCEWTRAAWFSSSLGICSGEVQMHVAQWITGFLDSHEEEAMAQLLPGLWAIWKCQNNRVFRNKETHPAMIMQEAMSQLQEWTEAQEVQGQHAVRSHGDIDHDYWQLPPSNFIKTNFDAGWAGDNGTGLGLIARSRTTEPLMAAT